METNHKLTTTASLKAKYSIYYQGKLMESNYKLTTTSIKPRTKYNCITIISVGNYGKKAVYSNKYRIVKSKMFYSPHALGYSESTWTVGDTVWKI